MCSDDDNWVPATIEVGAGAFGGVIEATLRAEDFPRFRGHLRTLYECLTGRATFDTMEGGLHIEVEGDGRGHFLANCEAIDQAGTGNRRTFMLDFDQTELPQILRGVDALCEAVPVVGTASVRT